MNLRPNPSRNWYESEASDGFPNRSPHPRKAQPQEARRGTCPSQRIHFHRRTTSGTTEGSHKASLESLSYLAEVMSLQEVLDALT